MSEVRCPTCGATVSATGACAYCGVSVFVDGVVGRTRDSDLKCPRCKDHPAMKGIDLDGLHVDACLACHGVFFALGGLDRAIAEAIARPRVKGEGAIGPAHDGIEPVRYARCPVCDSGMSRVSYSRKPLVIIDRCASHGDWCDGGELGQLKNVARSRGMDAVGERAQEKERQVRPSGLSADSPLGGARFDDASIFTAETRHLTAMQGRGRRFGRRTDLFDILWDLFGLMR